MGVISEMLIQEHRQMGGLAVGRDGLWTSPDRYQLSSRARVRHTHGMQSLRRDLVAQIIIT